MDILETAENTCDLEEIEHQTHFNTILPSFIQSFEIQSVIPSEDLSPKEENIPQENELKQVEDVVKIEVDSHLKFFLSRSSQLTNQFGKERTVIGFENSKLKLSFINQIAPTIFTNNEIKAKNGKALVVAICENTTNSNAIIKTGLLSSALVEIVVLDCEFGFNRRREKNNCWSRDGFNKSIVSERVGKRPLIVGNDKIIRLNNGFGELNDLSFTDNSSWTKTKKFRLGVKVLNEEILTNFPRIEDAVSEPFRVMDQRGKGYKKHHPPSRGDEVWRLEGIAKNGAYHQRLSSNAIENVDDFLKTYKQKGSTYLKQLLGEKVPEKIWKKMVNNVLECDSVENEANLNNLEDGKFYYQDFPSFNPTPGQHLGDNYEAMGGQDFEGMGEEDKHSFISNYDHPPLLPHGEASTSDNHE
ncbi:calmodulin-binding protein 60 G-like isoform X2 [Cucumis sativus]|uniref:calmodulin-binding protein 60 G-like isoform X2 n=1 Tax=Cucumis sativus TaxID=3659 RepID=UPI0012F4FEC7|nr:calmodulin-binding protein 60 G-like isoform X2 [Cucumis sativus]